MTTTTNASAHGSEQSSGPTAARSHRVALIPGDSTGPEVSKAALRLVAAAGVHIDWHEVPCGKVAFDATGSPLPASSLAALRETKIALKGKLDTPVGAGYESPNVQLRKALGLYACVRPVKSQPGITSRYEGVDFTIVRECTEDVYAGIEHQVVPGVVQSIKITTRVACERIVRHAFAVARREGRTKVTLVHKANIMKKADGLFLEVGKAIAAEHPDIAFDSVIADNACMQLVKRPNQYGVLVAQNLFGDLLSDLGAGLVGGISNVWGTLEGGLYGQPGSARGSGGLDQEGIIVFESIHGVAEHLEGKGIANPLPFIRAASALVKHLGEHDAGRRIDAAVASVLESGVRPRDLGGTATTEGFVDAAIARLQ